MTNSTPPATPYPFARFTEVAKKVLKAAQAESDAASVQYVTTTTLLLGLYGVVDGIASSILRELRAIGAADHDIPMAMKHVIDGSTRWANDESASIGTLHLLLALLSVEGNKAGAWLQSHGVLVDDVRATSARLKAEGVVEA